MYEAVCHWADLTPRAPALLSEDSAPLSYRAFLQAIDAMGVRLAALGIGRNDRVAVLHPGGGAMAVAVMGVMCHATAAPLNPSYTAGEFAVYLRDLRVKALAIAAGMDSPARAAAARMGLPVFEIGAADGDTADIPILTGPAADPAVEARPAQPDDVALLLTTSGTTSQSKIVPIRHRQLVVRCRNAAGRLELRPDDRCLNLMPLYHSHGLNSGLGVSLVAGASVLPMPQFDVRSFFRLLETLEPTWFTAVFTFHHQIHTHAMAHRAAIARSPLRFIHTSSGRLDPRIAADLESWFGVPMLGTYASTETGVMTGDSHPPAVRKRNSVGTSAGAEVAIFGEDGHPMPAGARGEVCVRGANVFDGYENGAMPEAITADGWFHTGDEGMLDTDGFLFLTGRVQEVINRGGEKISPSEVDDALLQHPGVTAAATFAIPHATLGQEAAAAVVPKDGVALSERDIIEFLRQRLTGFKVPRRILIVDAIPKGPTGKVQRHALAEAFGLDKPVSSAPMPADTGERPATPLERQLQTLWKTTLNVPRVGLDDDFFLLGGDSLQAVELFLRIEETLGRRLPRAVLFEASTVTEMAKHIETSTPNRSLVPIQPAGSRPALFCVHDIYGQVLNFRALARHLGPDQPFYGLQGVGLDGAEAPLARIEDMAARYIAEIRTLQPAGPYHLGGYSMGGLVAYEMAQQLRAAGETVGLLALFDTYQHHGSRNAHLPIWFEPDSARLTDFRPSSVVQYLALRSRAVALNAQTALSRSLFGAIWRLYETSGVPMPKPLQRPVAANLLAVRSYRMKPYDGDAVLFTASRYAWDRKDWDRGWRDLIRGTLTMQPIPGLHHEILEEPNVGVLARALADCLRAGADRQRRAAGQLTDAQAAAN
jgi:oxalate---CoA ligase